MQSTGENKNPKLRWSLDLTRILGDYVGISICLCDYSLRCSDYYSIIGFLENSVQGWAALTVRLLY